MMLQVPIFLSNDINKLYFKKFTYAGEHSMHEHDHSSWKLIDQMVDQVSKDYSISYVILSCQKRMYV